MIMSAGKSLPTLIMSLSRQGILFVIALFALSRTLGYTGVIMAQPVADLLSATLGIALVKAGKIEI